MSDYIPFDIQRNKIISEYIPFEIQSEIMKRLPVKSLIQFRSVSKQWKSCIDNPKFIKSYHINHTNPQHHLFVSYKLDTVQAYTSIVDNNTFLKQKFLLTAPESLSLLRNAITFSSVDGLLCFCGDVDQSFKLAVIWNPTLRKFVDIPIHNPKSGYIVVGFGVCSDTSDPKLVKINVDQISNSVWVVEVFTVSTRVWRTVYTGAPFKSCDLSLFQVFVNGVIYFRAYDDVFLNDVFFDDEVLDEEVRTNFIVSFDLKSEKFGEVCLPERLVHTYDLNVTKVNESLGLLEYHDEGDMQVCGVWSKKDGANKPFTKIYNIKVEGGWFYDWVLGFRNNGEVVIRVDGGNYEGSRIEVYEPFSGHVNGVGIVGKRRTFFAMPYMETLLLLNESDSTIH